MNKQFLGILFVAAIIIIGGTYLGYPWTFLLIPLLCVFGCCLPMISTCRHSFSKEKKNKENENQKREDKKCCE